MDMKTILLDVGGTFIKSAGGTQIPSRSNGSREEIAHALQKAIGPADGLEGIGVSIPGPFDYNEGRFLMKHKFAAVYGERFEDLCNLGQSRKIQFKYLHDVNAPLLGAVKMLGLQDCNAALITIGTGLGFSYAVRGSVQVSYNGSPAFSLWNRPCKDGILEDVVSARGICAAYARSGGDISLSAKEISQRAYAGEQLALEVYGTMGSCLAQVLQDLARKLELDVLLFGGQVSSSLSLFEKPLRDVLGPVWIEAVPRGAVFEGLSSLFTNKL